MPVGASVTMEVEKDSWLDMSLDDRIKAKRSDTKKLKSHSFGSNLRSTSTSGAKTHRFGERVTGTARRARSRAPGGTNFSITVDNDHHVPGVIRGRRSGRGARTLSGGIGKARRERRTNTRAMPYDDEEEEYERPPGRNSRRVQSSREALELAEASGSWKHDMYSSATFRSNSSGDNSRTEEELTTGSAVTISNLAWKIDDSDLAEQFSKFPDFLSAEIIYDRSGRSEGVALLYFSKRNSGRDFVQEYDGVKLDKQVMKVEFGDVSTDYVSEQVADDLDTMRDIVPSRERFSTRRGNTVTKTRGRGQVRYSKSKVETNNRPSQKLFSARRT